MKKNLGNENILRERRVFKLVFFCSMMLCLLNPTQYANASQAGLDAVMGQINALELLMSSLVSSFGNLITLWAILKFGLAMQGNDGASQAHAFGPFIGGFIISVAPQILALFQSA